MALRVFLCGGAAANTYSNIKNNIKVLETVSDATIKFLHVDTSAQNDVDGIDNVYIPNTKQGSGAEVTVNAKAINEYIPKLVDRERLDKEDINIIFSSGGGGTGATIAINLTNELIKRGNIVLPVIIVDYNSKTYSSNSMQALTTYSKIADNADMPIPILVLENTPNLQSSYKKVDQEVFRLLTAVSLLSNSNNRDIDPMDIQHALIPVNYGSVSLEGGLYGLETMIGSFEEKDNHGNPIIALVLNSPGNILELPSVLEQFKQGSIPESILKILPKEKFPISLVISELNLDIILDKLEERLVYFDTVKRKAARVSTRFDNEDKFGMF